MKFIIIITISESCFIELVNLCLKAIKTFFYCLTSQPDKTIQSCIKTHAKFNSSLVSGANVSKKLLLHEPEVKGKSVPRTDEAHFNFKDGLFMENLQIMKKKK